MLNPLLYAFASEWMRIHLSELARKHKVLRFLSICFNSTKSYQSAAPSLRHREKDQKVFTNKLNIQDKGELENCIILFKPLNKNVLFGGSFSSTQVPLFSAPKIYDFKTSL